MGAVVSEGNHTNHGLKDEFLNISLRLEKKCSDLAHIFYGSRKRGKYL